MVFHSRCLEACLGLVALEAVELHRDIAVAALAEILVAAQHRAGLLAGVAFDAGVERSRLAADALAHRAVALVLEHFHVVAAHFLGRRDALARIPISMLGTGCAADVPSPAQKSALATRRPGLQTR
jgi:hypothetical protein